MHREADTIITGPLRWSSHSYWEAPVLSDMWGGHHILGSSCVVGHVRWSSHSYWEAPVSSDMWGGHHILGSSCVVGHVRWSSLSSSSCRSTLWSAFCQSSFCVIPRGLDGLSSVIFLSWVSTKVLGLLQLGKMSCMTQPFRGLACDGEYWILVGLLSVFFVGDWVTNFMPRIFLKHLKSMHPASSLGLLLGGTLLGLLSVIHVWISGLVKRSTSRTSQRLSESVLLLQSILPCQGGAACSSPLHPQQQLLLWGRQVQHLGRLGLLCSLWAMLDQVPRVSLSAPRGSARRHRLPVWGSLGRLHAEPWSAIWWDLCLPL